MRYSKWINGIVGLVLCLLTTPVWAATQAPLTLEAANLYYSEETGAFSAKGNVRIQQLNTLIVSDEIVGDSKTGDVLAKGHVTWTEENNKLTGEKLNYNYKTKIGNMGNAKGNLNQQLVSLDSVELNSEFTTAYKASVTKCDAQTPDYKMTADKIVIYPGDKLIAYNASFWIKNIRLFSMAKFQKSLVEGDTTSSMPRVGYRSDDGFYISQRLQYPLSDKTSAMLDLTYYSKRGLETQLGLSVDHSDYNLTIVQGAAKNADDEWYKREPEITLTRKAIQLGNTPLYWSYRLQAVRISDDAVPNGFWQESATAYLRHKPISLSDKQTLNLSSFYQQNWYEDYDSRGVLGVSVGVNNKINHRLSADVVYNYIHEDKPSPFTYDNVDTPRELVSSVKWDVGHLWRLGVSTEYDLANTRLTDIDYTITRNLHCFESSLTYREKRKEWKFHIEALRW